MKKEERDYIAVIAMRQFIDKSDLSKGMPNYEIIARHAYCVADAMIKESNEKHD